MDEKQWLMKLGTIKNTTRNIIIKVSATTTSIPLNSSTFDSDLFDDANGELLSSLSLLALIILYGIFVFSGVVGNSTLLVSLCSQSTTRVKNPLLLALCAADLLVTIASAPLTIIGVLLRQSRTLSFSMANVGCKVFHYMQVCEDFSTDLNHVADGKLTSPNDESFQLFVQGFHSTSISNPDFSFFSFIFRQRQATSRYFPEVLTLDNLKLRLQFATL
jgi:hypothetical protein